MSKHSNIATIAAMLGIDLNSLPQPDPTEIIPNLTPNKEFAQAKIAPAIKSLLDLAEKSRTAILVMFQETDGTRGGTELITSVHVDGALHPDFADLLRDYGFIGKPAAASPATEETPA